MSSTELLLLNSSAELFSINKSPAKVYGLLFHCSRVFIVVYRCRSVRAVSAAAALVLLPSALVDFVG